MEKMRVAVYCRVANGDGLVQETTLKAQESALRKYASEHGYDVVAAAWDTGSGLSMERPGIRKICELAAIGTLDGIVSVGMSRYGRNTADLLSFARDMEAKGVAVISTEFGSLNRV